MDGVVVVGGVTAVESPRRESFTDRTLKHVSAATRTTPGLLTFKNSLGGGPRQLAVHGAPNQTTEPLRSQDEVAGHHG